MDTGSWIVDFLTEQLLQRASDTLWDRASGWIRGDRFAAELDDAFETSIEVALAEQLAQEEAPSRAREVILGVVPIEVPLDAVTPEAPLLVAIAATITAQIDEFKAPVGELGGEPAASAWSMLENELSVELDLDRLQRRWFEQFRIQVSLNRLRGGALTLLANHLDSEANNVRSEAALRAISQIGAGVSDLRSLTSLVASAALADSDRSQDREGPISPTIEDVRGRLRARSQRLLDSNPLVPRTRVPRRLSNRKSLSQTVLEMRGPMLLIAEAGEGKSVALAEAAVNLCGVPDAPLAVVVHWNEVAELPRVATDMEFAEAVSGAVFRTERRYADALYEGLMDAGTVLLVDGIDELDTSRAQRTRFARFLTALRRWAAGTASHYVLAGRTADPVVTTGDVFSQVGFARFTEPEIRAVIATRVEEGRVDRVLKRIQRGHLQSNLLVLNLSLMTIAAEDDVDPPKDAYSVVANLVPRVVELLVAGHWRTDGLFNDERTIVDFQVAAAKAAWNLSGGGPVSMFSHRELVQALGGDREMARELEDASNLIVGTPGSLQFLHRRISDHLLGLHAAHHPQELNRVATERFWDHSTKYLLHDTAIVAADPGRIFSLAFELWRSHPPAFDLGLEYAAAVLGARPGEVRGPRVDEVYRAAYDVCAARPRMASEHNALWGRYVADFTELLSRYATEDEPHSGEEEFERLVRAVLKGERLMATDSSVERARAEIRMWLFYRRVGTFQGFKTEDTFAPTGSIIMPHPDASKDEYLTLMKNKGSTVNWTHRKPTPGWLLCRLRPTQCDLNASDECHGGWTNRYKDAWYKPFGLRCAWVSAMARDRGYVESYLELDDLYAILYASNFEWSRTHAMLNLAQRYGEEAARGFRWWWSQMDTEDSAKDWFVQQVHEGIGVTQVGRFLLSVSDMLHPVAGAPGDHFKSPAPSLLSSEWNAYWKD